MNKSNAYYNIIRVQITIAVSSWLNKTIYIWNNRTRGFGAVESSGFTFKE